MSTLSSAWSGLRWPIKAIIIGIPLIGIGLFATQKGLFSNKVDALIDDTASVKPVLTADNYETTTTTTNTTTTPTTTPKKSGAAEIRSFNYQPAKPVNGELKGIVEVGATGFNSFIISMDKEKRWEIISKDFGRSLVYEGLATTNDIRSGLKKYIADMFDKGVRAKNMHFIISSGAQKVPKTLIIISELKKIGFVVNQVTPEQEGKLGLRSVLPAQYRQIAFVTDMGSANTKISWAKDNGLAAFETEGSKYYEKDLKDGDVYNSVKMKAAQIPSDKRKMCFIIGGVPFELANKHRHGEERYTILKAPSEYSGDKAKIKSGLNIYKAIMDATGCDTFIFDWDANFSIGFLLAMP